METMIHSNLGCPMRENAVVNQISGLGHTIINPVENENIN